MSPLYCGSTATTTDKRLRWDWIDSATGTSTTITGGWVSAACAGTNTVTGTCLSAPLVPFLSGTFGENPRRLPAPLAFSPYISASELVVEFMEAARLQLPGLTRAQFLRFTIADFFAFLLRRAAETDGVSPPEIATTPLGSASRPAHCAGCGRFLPRRFTLLRLTCCDLPCFERAAGRLAAASAPTG